VASTFIAHRHCLQRRRNSYSMTAVSSASRKGKLEAKNSAFESSFAAGLDLSELSLPSKKQTSAAGELLRIKSSTQACRASQEEREEERWTQEVAKAKGKQLQAVTAAGRRRAQQGKEGQLAAKENSCCCPHEEKVQRKSNSVDEVTTCKFSFCKQGEVFIIHYSSCNKEEGPQS
jgi:hypothetical protein